MTLTEAKRIVFITRIAIEIHFMNGGGVWELSHEYWQAKCLIGYAAEVELIEKTKQRVKRMYR